MSLIEFAMSELDAIGLTENSSDIDVSMRNHILNMVRVFSDENHSGSSAAYALSIIEKLLNFQPLSPLTGDDTEWTDVAKDENGILYQNKRCSTVFKNDTGAWDINGKVLCDNETGMCWTNSDSKVPVTFPYTPTIEYINVKGQQENE